MKHFSFLYPTRINLFLVILLPLILVIFNTQIHSLFAEQQNLTDPLSLYKDQLSLYNLSSEQEKKLFLQKWLNFSAPPELQKIPNSTLAIPPLNDS
ncbi:MAG TPA: hypothetical protein VFK40_10870 [Nitrososphaeraceae archaeon]|nr:hypothetical protein [Nitrososphaeraceae archaeon]